MSRATGIQAMHIANGIVNGRVCAAFGLLAVVALTWCVLRGRRDLDDRLAPMAGLVAAFIFAVQMLNFPVLPGVSGHLLGGALAALLVGPWIGALCVSIVLIVQALLFADGGLTALGLNISNMALLGTAAAYLLIALLLRVLPRSPRTLGVVAFIAATVSVVVASQGFVLQYWLGGETDIHRATPAIAGTMAVTHLSIGIGEGLITATTVVTVAKVRPDLVYALRRLGPLQPARPLPTPGPGSAAASGPAAASGLAAASRPAAGSLPDVRSEQPAGAASPVGAG